MGSEFQDAISDAFVDLSANAGKAFTTKTGESFLAWPARQPQAEDGKILNSPDLVSWFEMVSAPEFGRGDVLTDKDGKKYTVHKRYPNDPHTNSMHFAVLPGR